MSEEQRSQIESMLASSDEELEQVETKGNNGGNESNRNEEGAKKAQEETENEQKGSAAPEGSEGSEQPAGGSEELSEADRLRREVERMSKKLKERGIGIEAPAGAVKVGSDSEKEDGKSKKSEPESINFLTEEEIENLQDNPETMNAVLNRVYQQARQDALKSIPDVVRKTTDRQIAIKDKVRDFYTDNPDLKSNRDFVSYVASEVEAENPDKDLDWIFEKTAKEARDRLGLRKQAEQSENERRGNDNNQPAFARKPRGERRAQDDRTKQQKQIDEVISL